MITSQEQQKWGSQLKPEDYFTVFHVQMQQIMLL